MFQKSHGSVGILCGPEMYTVFRSVCEKCEWLDVFAMALMWGTMHEVWGQNKKHCFRAYLRGRALSMTSKVIQDYELCKYIYLELRSVYISAKRSVCASAWWFVFAKVVKFLQSVCLLKWKNFLFFLPQRSRLRVLYPCEISYFTTCFLIFSFLLSVTQNCILYSDISLFKLFSFDMVFISQVQMTYFHRIRVAITEIHDFKNNKVEKKS